jgi:hypothetical protein
MAKEYLLAHRTASNDDVVKGTGVSIRTVTAARAALISMGLLQRSFWDRTSGRQSEPEPGAVPSETPGLPLGPTLPVDRAAELQNLLARDQGPALTAEDARKRVSRIIRAAEALKDSQLELAAIGMFARLDAQLGARDRLGPGPPLNRDAKIQRSSLIFEAIGPSIAGEALVVAFSKTQIDTVLSGIARGIIRKAENEQSTTQDSPQNSSEHPPTSEEGDGEGTDVPELDGGGTSDGSDGPTADLGSVES